jgi:ParB-like chromosome segregation protein Spo0J
MRLPLSKVRVDPVIRLRTLDMDRVEAMIEFEEQGGSLPPITVVGDDNLLADGGHRLYAAETSGKRDIAANRLPGGRDEAIAAAIQLNSVAAPLPLSRTARDRAIKLLLTAGWTQEQIAKATGIAPRTISYVATVMTMRGQLA